MGPQIHTSAFLLLRLEVDIFYVQYTWPGFHNPPTPEKLAVQQFKKKVLQTCLTLSHTGRAGGPSDSARATIRAQAGARDSLFGGRGVRKPPQEFFTALQLNGYRMGPGPGGWA